MAAKDLFIKSKKLLTTKEKLDECYQLLTKLLTEHSTDQSSNELTHHEIAEVYNSRGHIRYLWVDFDEAIEDYTKAIQYDSSLAVAYYNRGQIHYRMGRYIQAEADLLQALKLQPDFTDAKLNLNQVQKDIANGHKFNI